LNIKQEMELLALQTRNSLGIGLFEKVNIFELLTKVEGISLMIVEMSDKISGMYLSRKDESLIVINSKKTLGHQHFTAAHEYYHFKFDRNLSHRICPIKKFEDEYEEEYKANQFAVNFLLPKQAVEFILSRRVNNRKIELDDVIFLEQYFEVSHQLMLIRLKELGYINKNQYEEFKKNVVKRACELGYSAKLYKPTSDEGIKVYSKYLELATRLYESGRISRGKYEELLIEGGYADVVFNAPEEIEGVENEIEDADIF